jgi:hypothetical protein
MNAEYTIYRDRDANGFSYTIYRDDDCDQYIGCFLTLDEARKEIGYAAYQLVNGLDIREVK